MLIELVRLGRCTRCCREEHQRGFVVRESGETSFYCLSCFADRISQSRWPVVVTTSAPAMGGIARRPEPPFI